MTERPILFTPANVRAILAGRKTQTRRLNKLEHINVQPTNWRVQYLRGDQLVMEQVEAGQITDEYCGTCPFGIVGDRLWVREAFCYGAPGHPSGIGIIPYRGMLPGKGVAGMTIKYRADWTGGDAPPWRPAIHMPRWACRLWLEITEIRVERVKSISEDDAKAEGCYGGQFEYENAEGTETCRESFQCLWESIHGPGSWEQNPWVWAITFRRTGSGHGP